jgi:hypothetical protein
MAAPSPLLQNHQEVGQDKKRCQFGNVKRIDELQRAMRRPSGFKRST